MGVEESIVEAKEFSKDAGVVLRDTLLVGSAVERDINVSSTESESRPASIIKRNGRLEPEHVPAVDVSDVGELRKGGAQVTSAEGKNEMLYTEDSVNVIDKINSANAATTRASKDDLPTETRLVCEKIQTSTDAGGDVEEDLGSGIEGIVAETTEIKTGGTVSLVTESRMVPIQTSVGDDTEARLSAADAEQELGSFTRRASDPETFISADKSDELRKEQKEAGVEVAKYEDLKTTEINFNSFAGAKRKDEALPLDESRLQEPTKRQRRWNSEKPTWASIDPTNPSITTDISKESAHLEISDIVHAPLAPLVATSTSPTPKASASTNSENLAPFRLPLSKTEVGMNGEMHKERHIPPPSRSPTVSLRIDRFVRPFTIKGLRELLEQTGTVKEMWMDEIKTHCYVTYLSVDEAIATRNALYHLQWPVARGKLLIAEFVDPQEVNIRVDAVNDKSVATPGSTPRSSAINSTQVTPPVGQNPSSVPVQTIILSPPAPLPHNIREKSGLLSKKQEPPIPTMDDLFKKTRTKPQIYFSPLTEEEVAAKLRKKQELSKPL